MLTKMAIIEITSRHGRLDCLKYSYQNGCPPGKINTMDAANNYECLKYLHENGCPWDEDTAYYTAKGGHLGVNLLSGMRLFTVNTIV